MSLDPITIEIIHSSLKSIADESYIALMKSAYSQNIKERCDHSTAIVDAKGRLVAQAHNAIPIHIASMIGLMECLLRERPIEEMNPGDIFVANDPHVAGGTHLPDVNLATPIFADGKVLGFVCNIAHHADIGGMAVGSMAGGMSEIYQEGLRIPLVKLFDAGKLNEDLFNLILLNVRLPRERRGDYNAQFAATRLAERRMQDLVESYGTSQLTEAFNEIIDRTELRMRKAVAEVPDGIYKFDDVMDNDGLKASNIKISLAVTIKGNQASFDFEGTDDQVPGNINVPFNGTQASVCYAMKALLDPEVPNNHGVINSFKITAPEGSLVNCVFPASVASRAHTSQRIIDVILGAMAEPLPQDTVAAANGANTSAIFAGKDPDTGEGYLYFETLGGGMGARYAKDGKDGVQVHVTNTSNLPVEAIEMEYPLRVESYGLVQDSGGAGRHRGGMSLERVVRPLGHTCIFTGVGERFENAPWGLDGGVEGGTGSFKHINSEGTEDLLHPKEMDKDIPAGELVAIRTPGAGGYGSPAQRTKEALQEDLESGKYSAEYLKKHYGFG